MAAKSKTIEVIIRFHDREDRKAVPADQVVWGGLMTQIDGSIARLIIGGVLPVTPVVTAPRERDGKYELVDFVIP